MPKHVPFTRRDFLRTTALSAAAAPFILPSNVWAAEVPPSERIRMGFIGMGKQNKGLLSGFLRKNTQVLAVCDVDKTRREFNKKTVEDYYSKQAGSTYKGCAEYNDFRELLARKDIDAVCIATPDHWHAFIGIAAANAGKDVYCEKPLTQSIHEARAFVNAVRKNNRVFQTGSMQRSSSEFRVACELVRNGVIGKVKDVLVNVGGPGKACDLPEEAVEPGLDWEMWLGPAPKRPYNSVLSPRGVHDHFPNWRNYTEYGGGMVTDWGAHHFDIAQWGLGMDESGPVEITPPEDPKAGRGARFKYANGVEVIHGPGPGVQFNGSEGKVMVNRGKFELWLGDKQIAGSRAELKEVETKYLADAKVKLYKSNDHLADFLACIKSRQRPICDVEVGARTVTVCHLVNLAYHKREKIKWDPEKNQFAGGTGNPAWLDIPHRDQWKVA